MATQYRSQRPGPEDFPSFPSLQMEELDTFNILGGLTPQHVQQFLELWARINQILLDPNIPDEITWKLTLGGCYSTKSAYTLEFLGSTTTNYQKVIWKIPVPPPKCKFFAWIAIQNWLWTLDRPEGRGWPNQRTCPLRRQSHETTTHLFAQCRYST